jgi:hypothetical protein
MATWRKVIVSGSDAELNTLQIGGGSGGSGTTLSTAGVITADAAITAGGNVTAVGSFIIGSADMNEADLEKLDGITNGAGAANKALVLDGNADIASGLRNITLTGTLSDGNYTFDTSGNVSGLGTVGCGAITSTGTSQFGRVSIDSSADYIDVSTDLQVIAAADITLDPAGGNVKPASNDDAALGVAGTGWSDLFLAEGAVINWDSGDFTATQAGNLLTLTGGNTRVDRLELDSASDYLDVDTDLKIVAGADIILDPAGNNVLPGSDGADDLGKSDQQWKDLYVHGVGYIDQLGTDGDPVAAYINSGELDGVIIGGESTAAITGTTIDATTDFTIDGLVLTADTITNDAALSVVSTGLTLDASLDIALSADGGNVTMDDGTTTVFDFNTNDPELKIMDDAQVANYASIAVGANGATTFTTVDTDAAAANLIITADGTVDIDSAGLMTLDSGGAINIEPAGGSAILLDGTISIDAGVVTGATSITSTDLIGTNIDGIIGADTARAGSFTTIAASGNATIEGNLVVNGTTTTLATTNLAVGDQFIFAATGSAGTNVDAGIIVQSGSAVDSGSAIYHDINSERWAVAKGVGSIAQAVTPLQMVVTSTLSTVAPNSTSGSYGVGEMWVETDTQDIYIRTA